MDARESLATLSKVQGLADTGQHAVVVEFLGAQRDAELRESPTLALLFGVAHARLGRNEEASRWVGLALERARERGDLMVEARALNVSSAIALESGQIDEAARCLMQALAVARRAGDHETVGRCSNNLGIIANMRGDYGRAIGAYTRALAAFQQADSRSGEAQTLHNMAITYRDQGDLDRALETANRAVELAEAAGDLRLAASTRGGRAEIRLLAGDAPAARREVEGALKRQRDLGNLVGETEDLRIWAGTLAATGKREEAEAVLRDVIARATAQTRPLLAASAERDLARLLLSAGRRADAEDAARSARVRFSALGAEVEVRHLDDLLQPL